MPSDVWTPPADIVAGVASRSEMNTQRTDNMLALQKVLLDGDVSASGQVHRHKTGTLANRPAAGNAGRFYTATDLGVTFIDVGSEWHVFSHIPALADRLTDDFHAAHGDDLSATGFIYGWRAVISGTGNARRPTSVAHSYIELEVSTSGGYVNLTPQGSAVPYIGSASAENYPLIYETAVRLNQNTNVDYHFGIMSAPSTASPAAPTSSIMFRVADGGNVFSVTRENSGGETTNDLGAVPGGGNIDLFRIVVNSASSVDFTFWEGGPGGTKHTVEHTAGIPATQLMLPAYSVRASANASKAMRVDAIDLLYKRDY